MSICVALNLSDGVVIAVDSAVTMVDGAGAVSKIFPDTDKLFQLGTAKVGIAFYGLASLHGRTIGSFIREFSVSPQNSDLDQLSVAAIAERIRVFFIERYTAWLEMIHGKPFHEIDDEMKGNLGFVLGGFSSGSFQSELWEVIVPWHSNPDSAQPVYTVGEFGVAWFASARPINRYIKGLDPVLSAKLRKTFTTILGRDLTDDEQKQLGRDLADVEYPIKTDGMPIQSGIACAEFLVNFVLGHFRFSETHPIVGGKARIGTVTYNQNAFQILP